MRATAARLVLAVFFAVLAYLLPPATATADTGPEQMRRVLLLYAEPRLIPAVVQVDANLRSTLGSDPTMPVIFHTEFLDLPSVRDEAYERLVQTLLGLKYRDVKLDLIFANGVGALRMALQCRSELGPDVPIVFTAVDAATLGSLSLPPDLTGVTINMGWDQTLDAALRIQPETRRVVVVTGTGDLDKAWTAPARRSFAGRTDPVEFTWLAGLSLEETITQLAKLPDRTIVLMGPFVRDGAGRSLVPADIVSRLSEASTAPIYGISEPFVGRGIVGGYVVRFELIGVKAAELGMRVLRGEKLGPGDIVTGDTNAYMFDWRQLTRWKLEENRLPAASIVRFREVSAWQRYRWMIAGSLAVVLLESGLIAGLLIQRARRKRAEEAARLQQAQLAHAQRVTTLGELTATLAHEINTPLGAIVSNAEAASRLVDRGTATRTDLLEALQDIVDDGQRASEVIKRLRAMLRKGEPEQKPCDLNRLIEEVLDLLSVDLTRAGISTEFQLDDNLPPVRGDAIQLQQVFLNLVVNAIDAMTEVSDGPRRLTVETKRLAADRVQACVKDTGVGVKEDDLDHMFEAFVTTKTSGLGMGLSISRSLVEAHGGTIRAERNRDRGLSVYVDLPAGGSGHAG